MPDWVGFVLAMLVIGVVFWVLGFPVVALVCLLLALCIALAR